MKIKFNNIIPFKGFSAINLFGILFVRNDCREDFLYRNGGAYYKKMINHEEIHTKQMKELLYVFFYVWYCFEWFIKLFIYWDICTAYKHISFEQEAYFYQYDYNYMKYRKPYHWLKFLFK